MRPLLLIVAVALATFAGVRWYNVPEPGLLDFIQTEPQTDWVAVASAVGAVITALEALTKAVSKLWQLVLKRRATSTQSGSGPSSTT